MYERRFAIRSIQTFMRYPRARRGQAGDLVGTGIFDEVHKFTGVDDSDREVSSGFGGQGEDEASVRRMDQEPQGRCLPL